MIWYVTFKNLFGHCILRILSIDIKYIQCFYWLIEILYSRSI
jgi:hypothetical protein